MPGEGGRRVDAMLSGGGLRDGGDEVSNRIEVGGDGRSVRQFFLRR
jgi:hypothetical protein